MRPVTLSSDSYIDMIGDFRRSQRKPTKIEKIKQSYSDRVVFDKITITRIIVSMTKLSIVIGSPRAYLHR